MIRIFITGGAGFIGANFVKYLLDKGDFKITVYDNLSTGSRTNLDKAVGDSKKKGEIRVIKADILDFAKLKKAIKGHEAVVHLAAHTSVVESLGNPSENLYLNSTGTFNVLEAARKNRIGRFIFASSNAAVGEQIPPLDEEMMPRPLSPYGVGKLYGEALCRVYFYSYGLKTVSLRFANAYGPYSGHKSSVIAKFIKNAWQGKPLEIYGDGRQTRDFIHVKDVCQAVYLSLDSYYSVSNKVWGEVFQIATAKETRIIDLADITKRSISLLEKKPIKLIFKKKRKGEMIRNYSNIKKAKKFLGFKPQIELKKGIRDLIAGSVNL